MHQFLLLHKGCKIGLVFTPFLVLAVFYGYVFWVTNRVGHIPHYNFPDPKTAEIAATYDIVNVVINSLITIIAVIISTGVVLLITKKTIWDWKRLVFISGLMLIILLVVYDPGRLFEWYVD